MIEPGSPTGASLCDNCGAPLTGRFCAACGQEARDLARIGFGQLVKEWLGDVFTFDSRVLRTLWPLVRRPGFLTSEYLDGRRVRYVPPLRLFVILSLVMVLAMSWGGVGFSWNVTSGGEEIAAHGRGQPPAGAPTRAADDQSGTAPTLVDDINRRLLERLPYAMLLVVPVMAFFVWLLHRRRDPHYVVHLIFTFHVHAFWFLMLALAGLLDTLWPRAGLGQILVLVTWAPYLLLALRRVYGGGWIASLARAAVVLVVQVTAFFAVVWALVMATVLVG